MGMKVVDVRPPEGKRELPKQWECERFVASLTPRTAAIVRSCMFTTGPDHLTVKRMGRSELLRALIEQGVAAKLPVLEPAWGRE